MKKLALAILTLAFILQTYSSFASDPLTDFGPVLSGDAFMYEQATVTITLDVTNVSCNGANDGSITVNADGTAPYVYEWSNNETTATIANLAPGQYSVTVTDNDNFEAMETVTVTEPPPLAGSIEKLGDISCNGASDGSAMIDPSGGNGNYAFSWSHSPSASMASVSDLPPGTTTVTVTDVNGCTLTDQVMITQPDALACNSVIDQDASCNGVSDGAATINAIGGTMPYSYDWSHNANAMGSSTNDLPAGSHTVDVVDENGCVVQCELDITEPAALMIDAAIQHETANDAMDGSITTTVMGGTGPYTYAWSNGGNTPTIMDLAPGSYTVDVTDANGCQIQDTYVVDEFGCALSATSSTQDVACPGDSTGQAMVTVENGNDPVTVAWSNGANGNMIDNLAAGTYQYTVTDGANCSVSDSVVISQPDMLVVTVDTVIGDQGNGTGEVQITVSGGTAPYSFAWSDGNIAEDLVGALSGKYNVTVTDAENCTLTTDSIEILMVVDILETALGTAVQVFPNPASQYITIQTRTNFVLGEHIEFYNIDGQSLFRSVLENDQVNVNDLPAGLYLMKLQVDTKYYFTRLLVLRE
ncbi:MAG: T9SS type A sorting domain-containing protein [Saprospiraceae bacterium]|nr:T9SS type A sorting domain-containing protein [Saprospiraceae bacterium]